jgi:hypothetical protein
MDIDDYGDQKIQGPRSKWKCGFKMANGRTQMVFHLPFALCSRFAGPFEIALSPATSD